MHAMHSKHVHFKRKCVVEAYGMYEKYRIVRRINVILAAALTHDVCSNGQKQSDNFGEI